MPASTEKKDLSFRRYRDGDSAPRPWQQAIFQAGHSYKCPTYVQATAPCQAGCPAGEDIRSYLAIARGMEKPPKGVKWQEYAFRRLTETNPFPAVMGRVCPAPCQTACNRNAVDDFVGINSVEHFIGEYGIANKLAYTKSAVSTGKKVAVIGGGPAGLSCAYQLTLKGHSATIFDEHAQLGGMMRYGIPGFRTPRNVLDAEIQRILDLGVQTRLNCRIGRDVTMEEIRAQFDAVFLGLGAQSGRALPCPGHDAPNVVTATSFLNAYNEGRLRHVGKRVVVVGGGDTSIDVTTVARRLGHIEDVEPNDRPEDVIAGRTAHDPAHVSARRNSEVTLTSVFALDKMQAQRHEVEEALGEGITIRAGFAPVRVIMGPDGRATGLRIAPCTAKFVGTRLEVKIVEGQEEDIPADLIVSAIGQAVDFSGVEMLDNGKGAIATDRNYGVVGTTGFFAGGDVIRPNLLTTAVGHGAIAADSIDKYLRGETLDKRPQVDVRHFDLQRKMIESGLPVPAASPAILRGTDASNIAIHNYENRAPKHVIKHNQLYLGHFLYAARNQRKLLKLDAANALGDFRERLEPPTEAQVQAEGKRCMSCGMCLECDNCVVYCPQKAVKKVPRAQATTGRYVYTDYDRCIGCHICQDVCPSGYIQMGLGE
jgi:dissimilatory sulfite reductase flavoprotein subunit